MMLFRAMKKLGGSIGSTSLIGAALVSVSVPQAAHASDWGCQVILCLATPGSPTTYAECVPPITKLWSTLARGGSFPTCSEAGVGTQVSKISSGYFLSMSQPDGSLKFYIMNTKSQTITQYQGNIINISKDFIYIPGVALIPNPKVAQ